MDETMKTIIGNNATFLIDEDDNGDVEVRVNHENRILVVSLTHEECAQLGSALYAIASTHKRRAANDGAIEFNQLAIGEK